jgi:hypothetical protein
VPPYPIAVVLNRAADLNVIAHRLSKIHPRDYPRRFNFRNAIAHCHEGKHQVSCGTITGANKRLRMEGFHHKPNLIYVRRVQPLNQCGFNIAGT